jgi:hypothetical protein
MLEVTEETKMGQTLARLTLLAALLFGIAVCRAELVYQPPAGTQAEGLWRNAGSLLLEGVARFFDALAAVEVKNQALARRHLEDAVGKLRDSVTTYEKVRAVIPRPRKVPFEKLSGIKQQQIVRTFESYKISPPQNEADAAALAANEVKRFVSILNESGSKIIEADLETVQRLLLEITRLQRIGTQTAEIMSTLR